MISHKVGQLHVQVEVHLSGIEPYETSVQLASFKWAVKLLRPDLIRVSWSQLGHEVYFPAAEVVGRYARGGSGRFDTGGTGKIFFSGQRDEDIDAWPAYVQEAIWAARKVVNVP